MTGAASTVVLYRMGGRWRNRSPAATRMLPQRRLASAVNPPLRTAHGDRIRALRHPDSSGGCDLRRARRALALRRRARVRLGVAPWPLLLGPPSPLGATDGSLDLARGTGPRDAARADRHPRHLYRLPEPGAARDDGGHRPRAVARPPDPRTGRALVRRQS